MSKSAEQSSIPKSVRHKRILDLAEDNPGASVEELAAEVPSASPDLVERVLDEYGDPANDDAEFEEESLSAQESDLPDVDALTDKQLQVLQAIEEQPEASQRELAELLGVSAPTIHNRANSIEGFVWENRQTFAESVLSTETTMRETDSTDVSSENLDGSESEHTSAQLDERITAIERWVQTLVADEESDSTFDDPALAHKVAHACMESENITEDEELQIFEALFQ